MNIQLEKIELIKRLVDVDNEAIIKKLKAILLPGGKQDEMERLMANPGLVKKIRESRKEIKEGKGVKIEVDAANDIDLCASIERALDDSKRGAIYPHREVITEIRKRYQA